MRNFLTEVRRAIRSSAHRPGLSSVVILTAAIAIGACTALFDLANVISWMPIPGTDPAHLVRVHTEHPQPFIGLWGSVPTLDHNEYTRNATSFEGLAGERQAGLPIAPASNDVRFPEGTASVRFVTGNYFDLLGVHIAWGRPITPTDDRVAANPVAVLSDRFFRQRLASDERVLGSTLLLNKEPVLVVGVADPHFEVLVGGGNKTDLWLADALGPRFVNGYLENPLVPSTDTLGRLRKGVSLTQAQAELQNLAIELDRTHPLPTMARKVTLIPARIGDAVDREGFRPILQLLGSAAGLLLLLACANIASLLLSRSLERSRETATRLALGASRRRLIPQLFTESLVLALTAGGLGVLFALAVRRLFVLWDLQPLTHAMRLDHRVLLGSLAACLVSAVLFGLYPALAAARTNLVQSLKEGAGATRRSTVRGFQWLAGLQLALATILLVATGAIAANLWSLGRVDMGFDDSGLVMSSLFFGDFGYSREEAQSFMVELERQVSGWPTVEATSRSLFVPPVFLSVERTFLRPDDPATQRSTRFNVIDDGYFDTIGVSLLAGRTFDDREASGPPTIIINEMLAMQVWPESDPAQCVGRTLLVVKRKPSEPEPEHRIVGVVRTIKQHDLKSSGEPILYLPIDQRPRTSRSLLARVTGDPQSYIAAIRQQVQTMDPRLQPLVTTSAQQRKQALVVYRLQAQSVAMLAALGVILSLLGVFGVMQLTVTRRRREFGVRMALGADRTRVLQFVLKKTASLASVSILLGAAGAVAVHKLLASWVENLGPTPLWIYLVAAALLFVATMVASLAPAGRASGVEPSRVLRSE